MQALVDALFHEDPLSVAGMAGISIVDTSRSGDESCYDFVFGTEGLDAAVERLRVTGIRSGHVPGAIAFYFADGDLTHVGIVADDGDIISKWGEGPVFKHKPHLTLTSYGEIRGYYIDPLRQSSE